MARWTNTITSSLMIGTAELLIDFHPFDPLKKRKNRCFPEQLNRGSQSPEDMSLSHNLVLSQPRVPLNLFVRMALPEILEVRLEP